MKLTFALIAFLYVSHPEAIQPMERFQHIFLGFSYPPFYNSYNKYCCKMFPGICYTLLDSAGYTCDSMRGRVKKTEIDGWIQFEISNVQLMDAGYYRCGVQGAPNYSDYYVEVLEVTKDSDHFQPPPVTTMKAPSSSTALSEPTGPVLAWDHSGNSRASWGFGLSAVAIMSISLISLITAVIGTVYCTVNSRCSRSDKHGETLCESLTQEPPETNVIVYTTVNFTAHQKPEGLYANLGRSKSQAGGSGADNTGMVEYSVLKI